MDSTRTLLAAALSLVVTGCSSATNRSATEVYEEALTEQKANLEGATHEEREIAIERLQRRVFGAALAPSDGPFPRTEPPSLEGLLAPCIASTVEGADEVPAWCSQVATGNLQRAQMSPAEQEFLAELQERKSELEKLPVKDAVREVAAAQLRHGVSPSGGLTIRPDAAGVVETVRKQHDYQAELERLGLPDKEPTQEQAEQAAALKARIFGEPGAAPPPPKVRK